VSGSLVALPSLAVTRTAIASPRSPLPLTARSSVAPIAPAMSVPFFVHWYEYVSGSPSGSCATTVAVSTSSVSGDAGAIVAEITAGGAFTLSGITVTSPSKEFVT
jgi:hypothetical protein